LDVRFHVGTMRNFSRNRTTGTEADRAITSLRVSWVP